MVEPQELEDARAGHEHEDEFTDEVTGSSFSQDLFLIPRSQPRQSRRQKRTARLEYGLVRAKDQPGRRSDLPKDMGFDHLKELQETDETLAGARVKAMEGAGYFKLMGGFTVSGNDLGKAKQLTRLCYLGITERKYWNWHTCTIPLAGHLGKKKTTDRVVQQMWQSSAGVVMRARNRAMGVSAEHQ